MASWAQPAELWASPPSYAERGPFVPLFDADAVTIGFAANVASALDDGDGALLFFTAAKGFLVRGMGIARVRADMLRAETWRPAAPWTGPDSDAGANAWQPNFISGAVRVREDGVDYVYLYGCGAKPDEPEESAGGAHESPCRLARVPRRELPSLDGARVWSGTAWVSDLSAAAVVLDHVTAVLSVSYNHYLQKYLALHSAPIDSIQLRWADRPQGPWHALGTATTLPSSGGFGTSFGAVEHPALRSDCEDVLYLSYTRTPRADAGVSYVTHFMRVELR